MPIHLPGRAKRRPWRGLHHGDQISVRARRLHGWANDLARALEALGVRVFPTKSDFFLADFAPHDAGEIAAQLAARQIMVRPMGDDRLGRRYMPITTSKPDDNAQFIDAVKEVLGICSFRKKP